MQGTTDLLKTPINAYVGKYLKKRKEGTNVIDKLGNSGEMTIPKGKKHDGLDDRKRQTAVMTPKKACGWKISFLILGDRTVEWGELV